MKRISSLPLLLLISLSLLSCEPINRQKARSRHHHSFEIDTVTIHSVPHEILIRSESSGNHGYGGILHSPECWCHRK